MGIILIGAGVILISTGWTVWSRKSVEMIAGYKAGKTRDKEGLARWVGRNVLLMGIFVAVIGLVSVWFPDVSPLYLAVLCVGIVLVISIVTVRGSRRYN